jgi:hypothetical protein
MKGRFVWRLDEMPRKGAIVVVALGSHPLRWAYLPEGAPRLDVESAITQDYRWYKSVDCPSNHPEGHEYNRLLEIYCSACRSNTRRLKGAESVQPMALENGNHQIEGQRHCLSWMIGARMKNMAVNK